MIGARAVAVAIIGASGLAISGAAEFRKLETKERLEGLVLTSDAKYLIGTLDSETTAVVVDAESLSEVARIELQGAGPSLSRGGQLFMADKKSGLVRIYSESDWELVNEIDTGVKNLTTLAAQRGDKFEGRLLASSRSIVNLVEVEKDTHRTLQKEAGQAEFSADGGHVIDRSDRAIRAFLAKDYLAGTGATPIGSGDQFKINHPTPLIDQFWLDSGGSICVGLPPARFMERLGSAVVADSDPASRLVYVLRENGGGVINVHQLDDNFSLLESIDLPKTRRGLSFRHGVRPCARRNSDGSVSLFWSGFHDRGIQSVRFRFTPPLRADSKGPYRISLPEADDNKLVSGPKGATLSDKGAIVWNFGSSLTPGDYNFKVKQTSAGKVSFFRKTLTVLPASGGVAPEGQTLLRVPPGSSGGRAPVAHDSTADQIALLDADRLLIFGKDGRGKKALPMAKDYTQVACLPDGYALAGPTLDRSRRHKREDHENGRSRRDRGSGHAGRPSRGGPIRH